MACERLVDSLSASSDNLNPPAAAHIRHIEINLILRLFFFGVILWLIGQIKVKWIVSVVLLIRHWSEPIDTHLVLDLLWVVRSIGVFRVPLVNSAWGDHSLVIWRHQARLSHDWGLPEIAFHPSAIRNYKLIGKNGLNIAFWYGQWVILIIKADGDHWHHFLFFDHYLFPLVNSVINGAILNVHLLFSPFVSTLKGWIHFHLSKWNVFLNTSLFFFRLGS